MTITELLDEFRRLGVQLSADSDKLVVDAPAGALSPAHTDSIREHKSELLKLFTDVSEAAADDAFELTSAPNEHRLSLSQERIWAIDQLSPGNGQFNLPGSWWLNGPLDPARFETALSRLIEAHHIFKRRFATNNGKAIMTEPVHSGVDLRLLTIDDIDSDGDPEQDLAMWLADFSRQPFDLANEPLLRVFLVAVASDRHYLALISHAAIWDAWCYDLFLNELGRLYEQDADDPAPPNNQYADYTRWQRDRQDSESVAATLKRETARLNDVQHRVSLPLDYADPDPADHSGARFNFILAPELRTLVRDATRRTGATPFMVLLTAYATLLCRYTGQETVLITVPLRGREKRQFERIFGPFTNNLFLRVDIAGKTFSSLLNDIKTDIGDAFGREIAPFERIVEVLNQDLAASAFFQLQFSFQNVEDRNPDWATNITLTAGPARDFHATHADISFWLREGRDSIDGAIDYRTAMFDQSTVDSFYQRFLRLTEAGLKAPDSPLSDLLNEANDVSLSRWEAAEAPDTVLALKTALLARGESVVVSTSDKYNLTAAHVLSILDAACSDETEPSYISLDQLVREIAPGTVDAGLELAALDRAKLDLAVAAWRDRFANDESRILIVDPDPTLPSIVAWIAILAAGRVLCLATGNQAADEVSVRHLIGDTSADVVYLTSPLMQAMLGQENFPTSPRYLVRAFKGAGSVIEQCASKGINAKFVLSDDATLGIGLTGSGNDWPHVFEHVEQGISVCVQDGIGNPQLRGVDGHLALALGFDSIREATPFTIARQNTSGQFCWPDADSDDNQNLNGLVTALLSYAEVADAHAARRGADALSTQVVAWIVQEYRSEITSTELRDRLESAGFEAPLLINVDDIPRGREGQVLDRDLPHPDKSTVYAGFEPPASDREKAFAEIWRQTLELERIGANDNFANLGGNSVQALVVLSETQKQLGWSFEPRLLFFQSLRQITGREPS